MAEPEHLYVVTYDIGDPRRWRRVFRRMQGYGEWLQLSVFQCRLSRRRAAEMRADLAGLIRHGADHVLILDLGPADSVKPRLDSLGRMVAPLGRDPVIL